MSHPHLPPYVRIIRAFLMRIGAFITSMRLGRRIVIVWRLHGQHHGTELVRHVADELGYAARKVAEIQALAGLAGAAA